MLSRRIIRVPVHFDMIVHIMKEGYVSYSPLRCTRGLPHDAECVGSTFDPQSLLGYLFFSHPSFDEVPEAMSIPEFVPEIEEDNTPIDLLRDLVYAARLDDEAHDDPEEFLDSALSIAIKAKDYLDE